MSSNDRSLGNTAAWGAVTGVAAYLVGYVVTYAWKASEVNDSLRGINFFAELLGAESIPTWKAVTWLFYGEHFVSTRIPTPGSDTMVNLVGRGDGMDLLYLIPPVLLILAGALAARLGDTDGSLGDGAVRGAGTVAGYLPLAVVGALVTSHTIAGDGQAIAPDLVTAVLLAGVVYPVAFGVIGGAISSRL